MRREFRFTWLLALLACIYLGLIFYSRWSQKRALIQSLEEGKALKDRAVVEAYGRDNLTILGFYATPSVIRPGETAQLCYGVSNSIRVRIEPHVESVWPSLSQCVKVAPSADTVYTLIAEDAGGKTATAAATVKVN